MMRISACVSALALMQFPAALRAQTIAYTFRVQAESRVLGAAFGDLGTATMNFTPEKDASFHVTGGGNVVHPMDAAAVYRYTLDMRFQLKRDQILVLSHQNTCNKAGQD